MMRTFGESLLMNYFAFQFVFMTQLWLVRFKWARRAFVGVGAFNLVLRSAYEAIGTHERLRMEVADDLMLGKLVKDAGLRQDCAGRHLHDQREVADGAGGDHPRPGEERLRRGAVLAAAHDPGASSPTWRSRSRRSSWRSPARRGCRLRSSSCSAQPRTCSPPWPHEAQPARGRTVPGCSGDLLLPAGPLGVDHAATGRRELARHAVSAGRSPRRHDRMAAVTRLWRQRA